MSSDPATLATLRVAGFDIISSKFVTQLQEQVAELQQRNAYLLRQNTNLTRTLNEELENIKEDATTTVKEALDGAHGRR